MDNIEEIIEKKGAVLRYIENKEQIIKRKNFFMRAILFLVGIILILIFIYAVLFRAPKAFPVNKIIHIEKGETLSDIADFLEKERVIRSPFLYKSISIFLGTESGILWGDYIFRSRESVLEIAQRTISGDYGLEPVKITLVEGLTVEEMADIFTPALSLFSKEKFLELAKDKEGYLFPDTYLFLPNEAEEQVIKKMSDNFDNKMESIKDKIDNSGRSIEDIIIMASIVEKEAILPEDKKIVAGILWKRLEIGMPLQVDATFQYINGISTFDLTLKDLKEDSPYNTYLYDGLPIGPIANPGLDSIIATIEPEKSPYLFYLSDMDSIIHYGVNFNEHIRNKAKYLK